MKNLWAPWRMAYIEAAAPGGAERPAAASPEDACIFCRFPKASNDRDNLLLHRGERVFVMLNRYPYSNAHLLIVPYEHEKDPEKLSPDVHDELFRTTTRMCGLVRRAVNADGMNVGMNLGEAAGAGIAAHLHVHIVPRWSGDTNFMPVLAEAKVIGEHLLTTYDRLSSFL